MIKKAILKKDLMDLVLKVIKEQSPKHSISQKNYKTIYSYIRSQRNFLDINKISNNLKKPLEGALVLMAKSLKENLGLEKVIVFKISSKSIKTQDSKYKKSNAMLDSYNWTKIENRIIKNCFLKVLVGPKSYEMKEFENAQERDHYLEQNGFQLIKLSNFNKVNRFN